MVLPLIATVYMYPLNDQQRRRILMTAAREIAEQRGEAGPLRVHHVQEAYQRLDREGKIPHRTPQKQLALR